MKLVKAELPEANRRQAKYKAYIPTVEEFVASGNDCMEVVLEDGDEAPTKVQQRLVAAIFSLKQKGKVKVSVRKGRVYLVRS